MKVYQQNIFGGEDEIVSSIPVIVLENKSNKGRYLAASIDVVDCSDENGDVDADNLQHAFMIVRRDLQTPGQSELDEKIAESEHYKKFLKEKYGEHAQITFDMKKWLEIYNPVNVNISPEQYRIACEVNEWECQLDN